MEKPVLLMDIDGVLNLFPDRWKTGEHEGLEVVRDVITFDPSGATNGYLLRVPTDTQAMLAQLDEWYDVVWFTMWNDHARNVFAPLVGLPDYPFYPVSWTQGEDTLMRRGGTTYDVQSLWVAKTPLVPTFLRGRPFAWVDDDHSVLDRRWLERQADVAEDFLLVTVNCWEGLTQDHVDLMIGWARDLTDREAAA